MIICQSMMRYDTTSETWTLEKDDTAFALIYQKWILVFQRRIYGALPYKMLFVAIIVASRR